MNPPVRRVLKDNSEDLSSALQGTGIERIIENLKEKDKCSVFLAQTKNAETQTVLFSSPALTTKITELRDEGVQV